MFEIQNTAMIVVLTISQWTARKLDKKATQDVQQANNAASDTGRYNKYLIASDALKEINRNATTARTYHYERTLPWSKAGGAIIPSAGYLEYCDAMRGFRDEQERLVSAFMSNYESYIYQSQQRLGAMFNRDDYPTAYKIESKFSFAVETSPVPTAGDFRVQLNGDCVDSIRQEIETRTESLTSKAMGELWQRLHTAITHIADKLGGIRENGKPDIFKNSLIQNAMDLCALLPKLNLTGDANLEAMRIEVENRLLGHSCKTLREDTETRKNVAQDAAAIAAAMKGYF